MKNRHHLESKIIIWWRFSQKYLKVAFQKGCFFISNIDRLKLSLVLLNLWESHLFKGTGFIFRRFIFDKIWSYFHHIRDQNAFWKPSSFEKIINYLMTFFVKKCVLTAGPIHYYYYFLVQNKYAIFQNREKIDDASGSYLKLFLFVVRL